MFFIYNFNIFLTILKLPVIYHASLHCSLFAKNTKQAAQLTITFILRAEMNQQFWVKSKVDFLQKNIPHGHRSLAAHAKRAKLPKNNAVL